MLSIDRRGKSRDDKNDFGAASRYGNFAIEMLINSIITQGERVKIWK